MRNWLDSGLVKVEWLAAAVDDRAAIFDYVFQRNPHAALSVTEALVLAGDSLSTFPYRGRRGIVPGTRELVIVRPYLLIYRVDSVAACVQILRVWHGAQDRARD